MDRWDCAFNNIIQNEDSAYHGQGLILRDQDCVLSVYIDICKLKTQYGCIFSDLVLANLVALVTFVEKKNWDK